MKYRVVKLEDEILIITEDCGLCAVREAEEIHPDEPRTSVTEYFQSRFTVFEGVTPDDIYLELSEGKGFIKDWESTHYHSEETILDALWWLCPTETDWVASNDLFANIFPIES